jgi:hypothetical protein
MAFSLFMASSGIRLLCSDKIRSSQKSMLEKERKQLARATKVFGTSFFVPKMQKI